MKKVTIYTDGACSGNPGAGGWGAVLRFQDKEKEISGYDPYSTNQKMELTAALQALTLLKEPCEIALHSDSAYLIRGFTEHWVDNWEKNGWKNSKKEPVANQDLWKALIKENNRHTIKWVKVKGHSDNELNNRCDTLATDAIKNNK
ncbi:MAG: ribonuclease HI [Clostridiales bacterium]